MTVTNPVAVPLVVPSHLCVLVSWGGTQAPPSQLMSNVIPLPVVFHDLMSLDEERRQFELFNGLILQLVLLTVMPNQMVEREVHHRYNFMSSL